MLLSDIKKKFLLIIGVILLFFSALFFLFGGGINLNPENVFNNNSKEGDANSTTPVITNEATTQGEYLNYIDWMGYRWYVHCNPETGWLLTNDSLWIDIQGRMHMKYTNKNPTKQWQPIMLFNPIIPLNSTERFWGYGDYIWRIEQTSFNFLDPSTNFAVWLYDKTVPDEYNEIDIEMTKWGNPDHPNGSNAIHTGGVISNYFDISDTNSTLTIQWHPDHVTFIAESINDGELTWGTSDPNYIAKPNQSQLWMGLMMWKKTVPTDRKPIEVIIKDFKYIPY